MSLRWTLRAHDAHLVERIEKNSSVSPVVAQILALRGISHPDQVASFLDLKMTGLRQPEELPGVKEAVEKIYQAVVQKRKIFIYGDYDADGMTATAILVLCLQNFNADVSYFVPNRLDDGYGLNRDALTKLKKRGAELIVTVDCGIASVDEVEFARQLGLEIVVTDHHQMGQALPAADAIIHPALPQHDYPFHGLCGAGVAFKLAWALCKKHCGSPKLPEHLRNFLFSAVSLAAIGTVCDVVPLLDENRILVHHGLNCMRQFCSPGLKNLMVLAKCYDKPKLSSADIGFSIGPRLNASGRLGQAQLGVELLICQSEDRAQALAEYIDQLNKNRDSLDRKILRSAKKLIEENHRPDEEPALVIAAEDWHLGVIGIVAGRIAEAFHRPTVLISTDSLGNRPGVGSCRSSCGVDIYRALSNSSNHLIKFGGHRAAAGLTIQPENIDAFREDFCEQVMNQVSLDELIPDLNIDAEAPIGLLTIGMMRELEKLEPFGEDNPRPILCASGVQLAEPVKTMGTEGRHLALQLKQHNARIRAVAFGKGDWLEDLKDSDQLFDFAFEPMINDFRGRQSVELKLIDFRPSTSHKPR
ncbi:MAG: single-stranded-DNA-specific exonuclease RecJ [Planctomycetota bacterium]